MRRLAAAFAVTIGVVAKPTSAQPVGQPARSAAPASEPAEGPIAEPSTSLPSGAPAPEAEQQRPLVPYVAEAPQPARPAVPPSAAAPTPPPAFSPGPVDPNAQWYDGPPSPDEPGPRRRWYGWQTLAVDVSALGIVLATSDSNSEASEGLIGAALVGYFVGPPLIHALHGHGGKALGSAGLRLGSAGIILAAASTCDGLDCIGTVALSMLTVPAVMAVDSVVIAREDVPEGEVAVWAGPWKSKTGEPGVSGGMRMSF